MTLAEVFTLETLLVYFPFIFHNSIVHSSRVTIGTRSTWPGRRCRMWCTWAWRCHATCWCWQCCPRTWGRECGHSPHTPHTPSPPPPCPAEETSSAWALLSHWASPSQPRPGIKKSLSFPSCFSFAFTKYLHTWSDSDTFFLKPFILNSQRTYSEERTMKKHEREAEAW